jgi:hypothetical protein
MQLIQQRQAISELMAGRVGRGIGIVRPAPSTIIECDDLPIPQFRSEGLKVLGIPGQPGEAEQGGNARSPRAAFTTEQLQTIRRPKVEFAPLYTLSADHRRQSAPPSKQPEFRTKQWTSVQNV